MTDMQLPGQTTGGAKAPVVPWIGLFIALFGMLLIRQAVSYFWPTLTFTAALWKESLIWVSAIALLIIVRRAERLPLSSIGLGTAPWWKSILWGLLIAVACAAVAVALAALTGYGHGPGADAFNKLPLWLITLIVTRAGIVEELFYRGYAIERLQALGLSRFWSAAIPLIIFAVGHWGTGAGPTLLSLSHLAASWPASICGTAIWSPT